MVHTKRFKNTINPIRRNLDYEENILKDLMEELSKTMPSWGLCIVPDPSRYVIYHVSIDMYGTPTTNKAVVLDKNALELRFILMDV